MKDRRTAAATLTRLFVAAAMIVGAAPGARAQDWGPWWGVGPFDEPGGATAIAREHPPERALGAMQVNGPGPALDETFRGKGNATLRWAPIALAQAEDAAFDSGTIDFTTALPQVAEVADGASNVVGYLYRRVECATPVKLDVALGSDDGLRFWLDGKLLIDRPVARGVNVRDHSARLELGVGVHHLLVKVSQGDGAWGFAMERWRRIPQASIDAAIDRGARFLIDRQLVDGSWACREEWGPGYTAFAAYTLLKCGVAPDHATVRRALAHVRARPPTTTYAAATALLFFAELPGDLRAEMEQALDALLDWQEARGRFGYPVYLDGSQPESDLSNTLFAALALRAAAKRGLTVPEKVWRKLAEGALTCQERPPRKQGPTTGGPATPLGFSYREHGGSTGSITTAAISILAIAREQLGARMPSSLGSSIEAAIQSGLAWLERYGEWGENPGQGAHHYYYVYGLERVGGLLGLDRLAGCTWYPDGADVLVKAQNEAGGWSSSADRREYEDTLLALLFLKRATHVTTGAASTAVGYATEEAGADVRLRATGDAELTVWVEGFAEAALRGLEWPGEEGRGPRVARVEFLGRFLDDPNAAELVLGEAHGAAERPAGGQRFAARVELDRRGRWTIRARVHAQEPPQEGAPGGVQILESPPLGVSAVSVLAPDALRNASEGTRNVLANERLTIVASSEEGHHAAQRAVDQRQGTSWRFAANDKAPTLRIDLQRPVRASRLALSHAVPQADAAGEPRVRLVEVRLNGGEAQVVELELDPLSKGVLRFDGAQRVRRIELRVLELTGGELGTNSAGFAELELFPE